MGSGEAVMEQACEAAVDLSCKPWLQVASRSQEDVSLSQETLAFGFQDPPVSQREFEEAMKSWPEEPDSSRDPSEEAVLHQVTFWFGISPLHVKPYNTL